jgi:PAS domain S-box-containing protein
MEFFASAPHEPDERLLASMNALGSQVGQFVVRRRAEEEVRASESRMRAMLEAALDAVVTMDARGRVSGWNHAAEATFGYSASEAIGRDMAELIVPPALRGAHRRGLARFLETGRPVVLDRRLELTGMHRDGTEFPVELTITRIALPGPPTFTGYLRDITARTQADQELRASRARLVAVADEERRRIQRNLHDGAQQRLVGLALNLRLAQRAADPTTALQLDEFAQELEAAIAELRELARGIHPSVVSESGLTTALAALAKRSPMPVSVEIDLPGRYADTIEATVYYVVSEALTNVARYASASAASLTVFEAGDLLHVEVRDDGVGGAQIDAGSGLSGLRDRVEAIGGALIVESPPGTGTRVVVQIELSGRVRATDQGAPRDAGFEPIS